MRKPVRTPARHAGESRQDPRTGPGTRRPGRRGRARAGSRRHSAHSGIWGWEAATAVPVERTRPAGYRAGRVSLDRARSDRDGGASGASPRLAKRPSRQRCSRSSGGWSPVEGGVNGKQVPGRRHDSSGSRPPCAAVTLHNRGLRVRRADTRRCRAAHCTPATESSQDRRATSAPLHSSTTQRRKASQRTAPTRRRTSSTASRTGAMSHTQAVPNWSANPSALASTSSHSSGSRLIPR